VITFKIYNCKCGFKGWAMENVEKVICRECGSEVKTEKQSKEDGERFTVNLLNNGKSA